MPNPTPKNKLLFDFYQNVKTDTEIFSVEDLNIAIEALELAKERLIENKQKQTFEANLKSPTPITNGKVLYLPKNQKTICANTFKNNKEIIKVVLNEGLKEIGEYAFEGCSNLREIVFPKNRLMLRKGCFKGCSSLKEVAIPWVVNLTPGIFEDCTSLEKVILPRTISNIYIRAFKNCRSLKEVQFSKYSNNYISIFPKVFENCISLESIELPKGISADIECFKNCLNLKKIYIHDLWLFKRKFVDCKAKIVRI